jgi:hypothetical protein
VDELAELGRQLVLLARHERGVRDAQAERVAEQRGDREPVGEPAHHPGLGGGAQEAGRGPVGQREADQEHDGGDDEQTGGAALGAAQPGDVGRQQGRDDQRRGGHSRRRSRHGTARR